MDVCSEYILSFWKSLNKFEVRYIMVGGFATNLHGYQRVTHYMDLLLENVIENRQKFRKAFFDYSEIDHSMIETMKFVPGWSPFKLNNGFTLNILTLPVKGREEYAFEDCLKSVSIANIYNTEVPFLHINQLIANKKSVNRPKDQIDVIELERIKKLRIEMGLDE